MTRAEVCERLNISRKTFYQLVAAGDLKAFRIGRDHRVFPTALDDYIARHQSQDTQHNGREVVTA